MSFLGILMRKHSGGSIVRHHRHGANLHAKVMAWHPCRESFFLSEDNLDSGIAQLIAYLCEGPRDQELGRTGHRNQCIILCRDDSESTQKFY